VLLGHIKELPFILGEVYCHILKCHLTLQWWVPLILEVNEWEEKTKHKQMDISRLLT
jgi:hypothetical protein